MILVFTVQAATMVGDKGAWMGLPSPPYKGMVGKKI